MLGETEAGSAGNVVFGVMDFFSTKGIGKADKSYYGRHIIEILSAMGGQANVKIRF